MAERMTTQRVVPPGATPNHGGIRTVKATAAIGRRPPPGRPLSSDTAPWVALALEIGEGPARQQFYAANPDMGDPYRWWDSHVIRALRRRGKWTPTK
jgi:hypothetical protein